MAEYRRIAHSGNIENPASQLIFYINPAMQHLLLASFLCVLCTACSSDDSDALSKWFGNQGIATSYGKQYEEIEVSLKDCSLGFNASAYMVRSLAALGNANGIEQSLYFGLEATDSLFPVWKLRADSIFYIDFYEGNVPDDHKEITAKFYWVMESETESEDTTWLKLQKEFTDSADISIDWKAGGTLDTFIVSLPEKLKALKADTLRLLVGIKALSNNKVLRIAPPSKLDIPNLLRVAQKTIISGECKQCLHAGVRESLNVVFEAGKDKIKAGKAVIFAQLVLPKSSDATANELGHPMLVYAYSDGYLEDYRIDTAFVKEYGEHPNLVFGEADTLKLQVTKNLRSLPNSLKFTLRLGNPMLNPKSLSFYNTSSEKVFSDRPAYSSYDFGETLKNAKLRLWYEGLDTLR
jgi:hypothetical protein